jgi:N-acetylmuramoyl-L-alanine amidase
MKTVPGADTRIRIVYPKPEQQIYEDSTFLMGSVIGLPPGAQLSVNGQSIPISPQGFFAFKIPIHAGLNPMQLEVRMAASSPPVAQELFALHGVPPLQVLSALPLAIHEETLLPVGDIWLTTQDTLMVACSASVDAEVSLVIPGWVEQPIPLLPLQDDQKYVDTRETVFAQLHWTRQRIPAKGYYQVQVPVADLLRMNPLFTEQDQPHVLSLSFPLKLRLRHGEQSVERDLPGRLTLLQQPRWATIQDDRAVTRTAPENGSRLTPQRAGTQVAIDGLLQGWARARLSRDEVFYVALESLKFESTMPDALKVQSLAIIKTVGMGQNQSSVKLAFGAQPLHACPILVESVPSERMDRLQIRLYGVCSQCDFIHYPPEDAVIRQIHWRQVAENVMELWIDLHGPLAGYDYAWHKGEWQITVKTLPGKLSDIHVLIDPGHGGSEYGSTGLNGLPEKELNLTVSRLLRDALIAEGFRVSLTRDTDQDLSLPARGDAVVQQQADMVLSIHHNALPDGRDPLKAEGASCFYYHAFSKPLAAALLTGLTDNRGSRFEVPNYGLFYDSLYMTRIHQTLAVLVEIGFFTNPAEFERLIDPEFQREAVRRLAAAARQYCLNGIQAY